MARPSKFKQEFIAQAEKLCKLGATDMEMADFFEVEVRTLYRWKAENEEFCQALKVGKEEADDRVERSLYARANGYEHDEVDIRVVANAIVQTTIRKYYPPDTTAAIFWLKNRKQGEWREMKAVELTGKDGAPVDHSLTVNFVGVK
jgi:DNA-binding NarL/FixJ family response regulator